MFVVSQANAQVELAKKFYDAGVMLSTYYPDVDSLAATNIYYSTYSDWTTIDGLATLTLTYAYTTAGNTDDTLMLILQGKRDIGNRTTPVIYNLDTAFLVGASTRTVRTTAALTLTATAPEVRWVVKESTSQGTANRNNGTLEVSLYAPTLDTWYDKVGLTRMSY